MNSSVCVTFLHYFTHNLQNCWGTLYTNLVSCFIWKPLTTELGSICSFLLALQWRDRSRYKIADNRLILAHAANRRFGWKEFRRRLLFCKGHLHHKPKRDNGTHYNFLDLYPMPDWRISPVSRGLEPTELEDQEFFVILTVYVCRIIICKPLVWDRSMYVWQCFNWSKGLEWFWVNGEFRHNINRRWKMRRRHVKSVSL